MTAHDQLILTAINLVASLSQFHADLEAHIASHKRPRELGEEGHPGALKDEAKRIHALNSQIQSLVETLVQNSTSNPVATPSEQEQEQDVSGKDTSMADAQETNRSDTQGQATVRDQPTQPATPVITVAVVDERMNLESGDDEGSSTPDTTHQENTPATDPKHRLVQLSAILTNDNRRPTTPDLASQGAEDARPDSWSPQSSDTSETASLSGTTASTMSPANTVTTDLTTPDTISRSYEQDTANWTPQSNNKRGRSRPGGYTRTPVPDSQPVAETRYERFICDSGDVPALEQSQLGKHMPETLSKLPRTPGYLNKARLPWIPEQMLGYNIKEALIPESDPDVQFNMFRSRSDGGVNVYRDDPLEGRTFEWPDFEKRGSPVTQRQASQELERFITMPKQFVSYYCGLMKSRFWESCPLYAGAQLADVEELTRVNQIYTHLGKQGSGTAMHNEDDRLRSVNVGFIGTKLFLAVHSKDTKKFEKWVRSSYTCKPCPQFVRHLNIFFTPEQLEAAGIRFKIMIQRPGDVITTKPHQYHQALNIEDSFAISINHLGPSETPKFRDVNNPLEVCDECGLKGLFGRKGFMVKWVDPKVPAPVSLGAIANAQGRKRKALETPHGAPPRKTRAYTEASDRRLTEIRRIIRAAGSSFRIPPKPRPDDQNILLMAAAILSRSAIDQFQSLVAGWRNRNEHPIVSVGTSDELKQYAMYLQNAASKSTIGTFQLRYARACLAREVDKQKDRRSRIRLSKNDMNKLAQQLEMTTSDLAKHLEEGRLWNRICGRFHGILPFLPLSAERPFCIRVKDWKDLDDKQLEMLHCFLASHPIEEICQAGRVLQAIVSRGSSAVFKWEGDAHSINAQDGPSLWETMEPVAD